MIGQHLDPVHAEGPAPALLGERQIHADGDDIDARELGRLLVEAFGLQVANRCIQRRHHADDAHVVAGLLQVDCRKGSIHHAEIRRIIAHLQFGPDQGQWISFHGCCSSSFHLSSKSEFEIPIVPRPSLRIVPHNMILKGHGLCSFGSKRL